MDGPGPAGHAPLRRGRSPARSAPTAGERPGAGRDADGLEIQHLAGNRAVRAALGGRGDLVRQVIGSGGRPIDRQVVEMVEQATGYDASSIQVHEGPDAARAAQAVDAEMFASGNHLVAPDGLDVTTREGAFKTVHEVHHIVNQQARGPVEGTETGDGLRISDPGDRHEQEADAVAQAAVERQFGS